ncbi:MAG: 2-C-methyl-D-erythritol 2,4-cyclodiphosphate synthase [Acidocella sp.]|nr:2-C-methyl-D-erythritol 2,4-cyclodiphosphate synthase [Acidocella sp.]
MKLSAILVAGGTGSRYGGDTPKQLLQLAGKAVIRHAAEALLAHVDLLQPVGDAALIGPALQGLAHLPIVAGGAERQDSVRNGLQALVPHAPDIVLIHDAARPIIPAGTVADLLAALAVHEGAIPAVPVSDTLKRGSQGVIVETVARAGLFRAQTPQAFRYGTILRLHQQAQGAIATDDAALLEAAGLPVALVAGAEQNIKITYQEDFSRVQNILGGQMVPRIGTGFDVHAMETGRAMIICGVNIPFEKGLAGHSDADVGIHALCDAIYGALAEGDIGRHFPPSEATWKDADSAKFLRHAAGRIKSRGGVLSNADITIICEQPKITPHAPAMRARLAELLEVSIDLISVKATTSERLGFTGRGEGIAAQAAVVVIVPA